MKFKLENSPFQRSGGAFREGGTDGRGRGDGHADEDPGDFLHM